QSRAQVRRDPTTGRAHPRPRRQRAARQPGGMNLAVRVVSGVVLVAIIAAALWIGTPAVATVVGAGALSGAWELRGLLGRMGPTPPFWLILPLSVWLGIRFVLPASDMAADWAFAAAAVVGFPAGARNPPEVSPRAG